MSRYALAAPRCRHKRRGIVTSHPTAISPPPGEAHAATDCCDRAACIQDALAWVAASTGGVRGAYIGDEADR